MGLVPGRGGVFGAILAGLLIAVIEKKVKEIAPKALKVHLPPFVAVLLAGAIILYVVQPITGWLSTGLTNFILLILDKGGAVAGSVIAALYLPLVMTGLHHGLTPIHLQLIEEVGYSTLQTLNSMAGAGQVGAALALLLKFKNDEDFKTIIKGALPVGILGIGEPLIYGVTLPLFTPFLTSCLGAAVGGAIVGWLGFGARAVYVSGILAIATNSNVLYYIISYGAAVLGGFVFTSLLKLPAKKVEK
jgi:PTS system sucrose-specific IIC component